MAIRRRDRKRVEAERELWREKARLRADELVSLRLENDRLRERLGEAHLARIEAQNPGIDTEQVREQRDERERPRGGYSPAHDPDWDADADSETWEHLRVPYEGDIATAGELTLASEHPSGTCAFCDQREDADAEPSHIEHDYLSTACLHGLHDRCRLRCKFCYTECECTCGHQDLQMDQAVLDRHGQWWQPIEEPPGMKPRGRMGHA